MEIGNYKVGLKNNSVNIAGSKKSWLLFMALSLFLLDRYWGYIYTKTIYANVLIEYTLVLFFLVLFLRIAFRYNWGRWSSFSKVWAPYIMFTFLGYALTPAIRAPYWLICLIIILIAKKTTFFKYIPSRVIFYSGIIALIGIGVQLFLPSFYSSHISGLFIDEERMEKWGDEYGFNGFTYQLDTTGKLILYAEVILLYLKEDIFNKYLRNNVFFIILLIILIAGVLLTGKRTLSAIAIVLPFIVYLLAKKWTPIKVLSILSVCFIAYFAFDYFVSHVYQFSDSLLIRRFAESYAGYSSGSDVSSGRSYLYDLAWKVFSDNPLFGIGVGEFRNVTHAYTAVHNTYLQVLCEQGLVGFALYILPIIYCLVNTLKLFARVRQTEYEKYLNVSLALQLIYILYALTGNENIGTGYIMYFIGIAIIISIEDRLFYQKRYQKL